MFQPILRSSSGLKIKIQGKKFTCNVKTGGICISLNSRHKERAFIEVSLIFPSTRTKTLKGILENIIPVYKVVQI
jgi:hypothetical protein